MFKVTIYSSAYDTEPTISTFDLHDEAVDFIMEQAAAGGVDAGDDSAMEEFMQYVRFEEVQA